MSSLLRASSTQPLRRHVSCRGLAMTSPLNQEIKAKSCLTTDKQRDLISLYHQAESCISLNNLSEIIDHEFTNESRADRPRDLEVPNLTSQLNYFRKSPKYMSVRTQIARMRDVDFGMREESKRKRTHQVLAALNGMDTKAARMSGAQIEAQKRVGLESLHEYIAYAKATKRNLDRGADPGSTEPDSTDHS